MPTLDDFFRTEAGQPHPRLRGWIKRLEADETATVEIFRPKGEFGPGRPMMYVQFAEHGKPTAPTVLDEVAWDDDLNDSLIERGVRAINDQQEAVRFSLGLRASMRKAARESGDGYFNAVLVDLIKESGLAERPEIAELMPYIYVNPPHREGGVLDRYTICREWIAGAISRRAKELTEKLQYPQDQAKGILVSSLAHYLDERFSVSTRREYGLL